MCRESGSAEGGSIGPHADAHQVHFGVERHRVHALVHELRGDPAALDGAALIDRLDLTVDPGTVATVMGPSGSGKSTIAAELERALFNRGQHAYVLDGVPAGFTAALGIWWWSHVPRERLATSAAPSENGPCAPSQMPCCVPGQA